MLRLSRREPGLVVSGILHAGLIVAALIAFASVPPLPPPEEAIAVEVVSDSELRAITRGEKTAKEIKPDPKPRVDKLAELKEDNPEGEAKRDVPVPPSRPREVEVADKVAAVQPEQQKVEPPKQEPEVKPERQQAEEPIPEPPRRPPPPKAEDKPKPAEKVEPKPDPKQLAKLIDKTKPDDKPKAKPAEPERKFNISDIRQLLENKDKPESSGAKGQELNRTANLGLPNANDAKMSPSQVDALNALVVGCIKREWTVVQRTRPDLEGFKIHARMSLSRDGALLSKPQVVNSSSDPDFPTWSSRLLSAIHKCAPFKIPSQYDAFYSDWRDWNLLFDSKDLQG